MPEFKSGLPHVEVKPQKLSENYIIDLKVNFDPKTGKAIPDESDKKDLVALIQTYKDQCGVEAMKRLIKTGQAQPEDFSDDGKSGMDTTIVPDTAQGRANLAAAAAQQTDQIKQNLNLPDDANNMTDEQLTALIKGYIEKNPDKFIKSSEVKQDAQ